MSTQPHSQGPPQRPATGTPAPATWLRRIAALFADWIASSLVAAFVLGGFTTRRTSGSRWRCSGWSPRSGWR